MQISTKEYLMAKKTTTKTDLTKLKVDLNSARKSLLNFRFQKLSGQLEKTSEIKKTRKKIAQLLTEINNNKGHKMP